MTQAYNILHDRIGARILNELLATRLDQRDISPEDVTEALLEAEADQLTALGVRPAALATASMEAIVKVLAHDDIIATYIDALATLMWNRLGYPTEADPPASYYRAAKSCYALLLHSFNADPE